MERQNALRALDEAAANIASALEFSQGGADDVAFAAALWPYWDIRGHIEPGIQRIERALHTSANDHPDRADALHGLGVLRNLQDDLEGSEAALRQSLALSSPDSSLRARTLNSLALLLDKRGEHKGACALVFEALSIARAGGDSWDIAGCLNTLGMQHRLAGELRLAEDYFTEAQSIYESLQDWPSAAATLNNLGCIANDLGDYGKTRVAFERGLAIFRDLNRPAWTAYALHNLGDVLARQGDWHSAESHLLECLAIRNQLNDHFGIAATVNTLAAVSHGMGETVRAVRLAAGADALRRTYETPLAPCELADVERDIASFRSALPKHDFEAAWAFGVALSLEQLVTYARERRLLHATQEWESERVGEGGLSCAMSEVKMAETPALNQHFSNTFSK
jgi:tetratricopeptide (TPR) repeat protein